MSTADTLYKCDWCGHMGTRIDREHGVPNSYYCEGSRFDFCGDSCIIAWFSAGCVDKETAEREL